MKKIFYRSPNPTHRKDSLYVDFRNTVSKLEVTSGITWNSLPENIK